ncbi:hypothetical protein [Thalassotalea sp. PS06]|uniref:hypothetical protein n=1 Tax=Thalassotalea sp. PS06 TaxID=2594005 RepID=UPI001163885B|nr:hypothetical protein [Thalassotalea sp. PS06]QDP00598.1 hypothetical protein FNC98_04055 [Thalassotalea sp. PS06]
MMHRRLISLFIVFITSILACNHVQATAVKYRSFSDLMHNADAILKGQVSEISSRRMENGTIVSFVTLSDLELLKGEYAGAEFTLAFHGGEVNGLVQKIQGSPEFHLSQQLILFLQGNGKRMVPLSGWGQGMFIIKENRILDYQTNPVVDIVNDQIVVNRLVTPNMIVVGAPQPETFDANSPPLLASSFIEQIKAFPTAKSQQPLESVEPRSFSLPNRQTSEAIMRGQ